MRIREIARKRLVWIPVLSVLALLAVTLVLYVLVAIMVSSFVDGLTGGKAIIELSPDDYLRKSLVHTIPELQWTPDGTHVVFAFTDRGRTFSNRSSDRLERRLYVLASDGSEMLPVTSRNEIVFSPTVSPDSSRVAYSTGMRDFRIEISSLDGSDKRRFTNEEERAVSPAWSPDGDRIAFVGAGSRRAFLFFTRSTEGIYTVSADGSDIRRLVDVGAEEDGLEYLGGLSWSPDGQFLAFWGRDNDFHVRSQAAIYMVKADGSGLTPLFSASVRSSPRPTEVSSLAWSPDGRRIAFLRDVDGLPKLYTVGLDGLEPRVIASPDVEYPASHWTSASISWSPDGSRILFSLGSPSVKAGILEPEYASDWGYYPPAIGTLYIVNPDGSDLGTIGRGIYSVWSPDGSRIANVVPADHEAVLYTIDPDASDVRVMVRRGGDGSLEAVGPEQRPSANISSCSAGVVVADPESTPGLVRDCEALVETIGRIAVLGLNWDADTPIARWEGVSLKAPIIEEDGSYSEEPLLPLRVRGLSLPDRGLIGDVLLSVTDLSALRSLDLSHNQLSGPIPQELGRLTELRVLNLNNDRNELSGPIPSELGNLTNLRELALAGFLTGPIPPELGRLTKLETLTLYGRFDSSIPSELGNLTNLRELTLAGFLTGPIPPELGRLTKLETLTLYGRFDSSIPSELGNLASLEALNLINSQLTGSIPPELGSLSSLEQLNLSFNDLSGPIPAELEDLSQLKNLDVGFTNISGCIPSGLQGKVIGYIEPEHCKE